jgi:hypothetical protein
MYKTEQVAQVRAFLVEWLPDRSLRGHLVDKLCVELLTDAGLYALRTLVAGVIVATNPGNGGEVVVGHDMVFSAFQRVGEAIYSYLDGDEQLDSYAGPGMLLTDELCTWSLRVVVPPMDAEERSKLPALDEKHAMMLLSLAETVICTDGVSAEQKVAQIKTVIAAAAS